MLILMCMGCAGALLLGVCYGRLSMSKKLPATVERTKNLFEDRNQLYEGRYERNTYKQLSTNYSLACPVAGEVTEMVTEGEPYCKLMPARDSLYAPVSGKVVKIGTMGNSFVIRTQYESEVTVQVGAYEDDLMGSLFRSRVICNELVECGKLLMQFDLDALRSQEKQPEVVVTLHSKGDMEIKTSVTSGKRIKAGDELFSVRPCCDEE